jgi:PRTRC genetic system protein A
MAHSLTMTGKTRMEEKVTINLRLISATLHTTPELPTQTHVLDYVVAGNGLFVRAENSIMAACVPAAKNHHRMNFGLNIQLAYLRLKVPKVPEHLLWGIYAQAHSMLPSEAMFQFVHRQQLAIDAGWSWIFPQQTGEPSAVEYADTATAAIDLHSHGNLFAFYSGTDDADELGFRLYCVIGEIATNPHIICRVGIYGHTYPVNPHTIFEGLGPFKALSFAEVLL